MIILVGEKKINKGGVKMKINGKQVIGNRFAWDGCHKIYIIEDNEDYEMAKGYGYDIYDISEIEEKYDESCGLRFIQNWKLDKQYVRQCEDARFEN